MRTYVSLALIAVAALASQARAGFLSANWDLSNSNAEHIDTGESLSGGGGFDAQAWDHSAAVVSSPDTVYIHGETDSDPVLFISQSVVNNTGVPWIGYTLDCSAAAPGTVAFIMPGSTSGSPFTLDSFSATHIDFGVPGGPVMPGDSVTINYFIDIASTGTFSLTIVQGPVLLPEPASMGILAVGALALLRRRR